MNQAMTETLTAKQIDNRRYYAKNAETIRAKKRASYEKLKKVKPVRKIERSVPAVKKVTVKTEPTKTVRSRIEDFKLAKELGIEVVDL